MALTKVTNTGIADDAVTTDKIEDGTVVAADIAPGTIANAKLANSSITVNGSSVSLGGTATLKHIDWQAVTVADGSTTLNAEAGKGYFLDTNAGVIEVFLPSSPTRGDKVVLADYSGTFATNQIIINTGGELLDSTAGNDFKVTTNNAIVELVYVDSAKGWLVKLNQAAGTTPDSALTEGNVYNTDATYIVATGGTITTSGDYKIHTFTGDGCFAVSTVGNPAGGPSVVDYLVVAGGGSGGIVVGGGAGAGGFRESHSTPVSGCYTASPLATPTGLTLTATTYPVTVGAGGAGSCSPGVPGSNSIFSTITSAGGGNGGNNTLGGSGGSGGGTANRGGAVGGAGNTPPVSPPQGNPGGAAPGTSEEAAGAGGGGAGSAGTNALPATPSPTYPTPGMPGGCGVSTSITGSPVTRAGGGGGGGRNNPSGGAGGPGGGGAGAGAFGDCGTSGAANTGSGGGGTGFPTPQVAGSGGKGIVVIRYKFQN